MPSLSAEEDPFRDLRPYIKQLVGAFGPRRTFWGTDLTRMPCTCRGCVSLFTEELPSPKGEDLEWVMGRGVCARPAAARQVKLLSDRGAGTGAPRIRRDPG